MQTDKYLYFHTRMYCMHNMLPPCGMCSIVCMQKNTCMSLKMYNRLQYPQIFTRVFAFQSPFDDVISLMLLISCRSIYIFFFKTSPVKRQSNSEIQLLQLGTSDRSSSSLFHRSCQGFYPGHSPSMLQRPIVIDFSMQKELSTLPRRTHLNFAMQVFSGTSFFTCVGDKSSNQ